MARTNSERKHKTFYTKAVIALWEKQTPEFKQKCFDIGKPKGYTGINVFYYFLYQYSMQYVTAYEYKEYVKKF